MFLESQIASVRRFAPSAEIVTGLCPIYHPVHLPTVGTDAPAFVIGPGVAMIAPLTCEDFSYNHDGCFAPLVCGWSSGQPVKPQSLTRSAWNQCDNQSVFRIGESFAAIDKTAAFDQTAVESFTAAIESPAETQPGLGDMIASGLSFIGITKERAQRVANAVGIKDCGCSQRQALMNSWGAKYLGMSPGVSPQKNPRPPGE